MQSFLFGQIIMGSIETCVIESKLCGFINNCVIELKEFFFHGLLCSWLLNEIKFNIHVIAIEGQI